MIDTIINTVNQDILKSFKTLQKNKSILYVTAIDNYLISINDNSIIIYENSEEIDFEGTFKLIKNRLIPVEYELEVDLENILNLSHFIKLKSFDRDIIKLQKYCYDQKLFINISEINDTITKLFKIYESFILYKNIKKNEVLFVFNHINHTCFLLTRLI